MNEQVLFENESETTIIFLPFSQIEIILVFSIKFLNIVCLDQSQKSHSFYIKILQNLK